MYLHIIYPGFATAVTDSGPHNKGKISRYRTAGRGEIRRKPYMRPIIVMRGSPVQSNYLGIRRHL